MAAGNWVPYTQAILNTYTGAINWTSSSIYMALVTASYTPAEDTDATWANVSANESSGTGYTTGGVAVTSPAASASSGTSITGTAQGGSSTTITLASSASATNNAYNAMVVKITAGTGNGQSAEITGYVGTTKVATVSGWTTAPDATSVYQIVNAVTVSGGTSSWTNATVSAAYAVLVLRAGGSPAAGDKLLAYCSLNGGTAIASTNGTFQISGYSIAATHNVS